MNRYRVSGIRQPGAQPWSVRVSAPTAADAWFIAEKRYAKKFVIVQMGKVSDRGNSIYTVNAPEFELRSIEAIR